MNSLFNQLLLVLLGCFTLTLVTGCQRSSCQLADDTRTCTRYLGRGVSTLWGGGKDSRQICSKEDFYRMNSYDSYAVDSDDEEPDFLCMLDDEGEELICMNDFAPSTISPGAPKSSIPGIESFQAADSDPALRKIFEPIYFPYNSNAVQGVDNERILERIAQYMNQQPNLYLFIAGHCDERGPQAFNLSLGARRAQEVRHALILLGVDGERIFTVSYGKERPKSLGHDESAWKMNRRAEFYIYNAR